MKMCARFNNAWNARTLWRCYRSIRQRLRGPLIRGRLHSQQRHREHGHSICVSDHRSIFCACFQVLCACVVSTRSSKRNEGKKRVMMHPVNYRGYSRCGLALCIVFGVSFGVVVRARLAGWPDQDVQKLNRLVQTTKGNTAAMQMFREGRDLIEAQNWQKASEKFQDFITGYPKDKDLDAALYWFGYALQKQGKNDEAAAPLLKLIKNFPGSSWRREAQAMLVVLGRKDAIQDAFNRDNCEIKILALQSLFQANKESAINSVADVLKSPSTDCPGLKSAAVSL